MKFALRGGPNESGQYDTREAGGKNEVGNIIPGDQQRESRQRDRRHQGKQQDQIAIVPMQEFDPKCHGLELRPMNLGLPAKECTHGHSNATNEEKAGEEHQHNGNECPQIAPVVPIPNTEREVQTRPGKDERQGEGELVQAFDQQLFICPCVHPIRFVRFHEIKGLRGHFVRPSPAADRSSVFPCERAWHWTIACPPSCFP